MAVCTFLARKKLNYASDHLEEHANIVHPHAIVKCNVTVDLNNAISFAALCKIISRVMETCFLLFKTSHCFTWCDCTFAACLKSKVDAAPPDVTMSHRQPVGGTTLRRK